MTAAVDHHGASVAQVALERVVRERSHAAAQTLRRNLLVFGLGGLILPFPFIKLIDMALAGLHLVA